MNHEDDKYCDGLLRLLEKAYTDYLLLNRMIYKVKNLFFRQKQYKYIVQLKKMLSRFIFESIEDLIETSQGNKKDASCDVIGALNNLNLFKGENLKDLCDLMEKIGMMIKEMLKLKLYLPYSVVMLNVISRLYLILQQIKENKEIQTSASKIIDLNEPKKIK